jgi:hypothetical protein
VHCTLTGPPEISAEVVLAIGMFKVALSLLGSLQPKLMALDDFESIVMLMREWKREGKVILQESLQELLARADKFVINREVLDRLQESFASEILSIALIRSQVLLNERETQAAQGKAGPTGTPRSVSPAPRSGLSAAFQNHFPSLAALGHSTSNSSASAFSTGGSGRSTAADDLTTAPSIGAGIGMSDAANSALASLSATERRKVIQKQQQQEAEVEQQLMSGAEAPVFWLLRYGSKLPEKVLMVSAFGMWRQPAEKRVIMCDYCTCRNCGD